LGGLNLPQLPVHDFVAFADEQRVAVAEQGAAAELDVQMLQANRRVEPLAGQLLCPRQHRRQRDRVRGKIRGWAFFARFVVVVVRVELLFDPLHERAVEVARLGPEREQLGPLGVRGVLGAVGEDVADGLQHVVGGPFHAPLVMLPGADRFIGRGGVG